MKDIITYCKDTTAFLTEAAEIDAVRIMRDESDNPVGVIVGKTPTVRLGAETISRVRCDAALLAQIEGMATITVLAKAPVDADVDINLLADLDSNPANAATYDRVRGPLTDEYPDGEGGTIIITRERMIGSFA